jgi:type II secretory pathway pseudopilin PulG
MDRRFDRSPSSRAFTLLELLVSISVILLMVALLMPALAKSRDAAQNMVCMANLRQQGVGLESYALDARGSFPPDRGLIAGLNNTVNGKLADNGWDETTNSWNNAADVLPLNASTAFEATHTRRYAAAGNDQPWWWFAWDQVGRVNKIFQCPSEVQGVGQKNLSDWVLMDYQTKAVTYGWGDVPQLHWPLQSHAYAYNYLLGGDSRSVIELVNASASAYAKLVPMPLSSIPKQSYVIVTGDGFTRDLGFSSDYQRLLARHGSMPRVGNPTLKTQGSGTYNALHLDGHVSAYTKWGLAPTDPNHPIRQPDRFYPGKTFVLRNGARAVNTEAASPTQVYFPGRP